MAIKKSELYSSIWKSCDELRGGMDASQYKDYVLTLLFVKYVSDKYANQPDALIEVPPGGSFNDMVRLKNTQQIGDGMNAVLGTLAKANDLSNLFNATDFDNSDKLGSGPEKVERLTNLIAIFENQKLNFARHRAENDDLLGDAYEFLMRHFATQSGKSKGQFYTPSEVSRIMAKVIGINDATALNQTIYDPTCGSGSLLIKAAAEAARGITIYGQEMDNATVALAQMNMILHDKPAAAHDILQGNTLANPRFVEESGMLKTFDFAVSNPPFSSKAWRNGFDPLHDRFARFADGVAPAKNGDYAFLQHLVRSLKRNGKGAIILPHGVLFRGNAEAEIRRNLVRRGLIKGIIGLPANLFYGTGIPACIIVVDKENAEARRGIFMIDASRGFVKDGNKNRLRHQDIHKIVDVFNKRIEIPKYSRMVSTGEIAEKNDYNLNLPRYIDSSEPEDVQDIGAHLKGGIPARDVDALSAYWAICPSLRDELFAANAERAGYVGLRVESEEIGETIGENTEIQRVGGELAGLFERWRMRHQPTLENINGETLPKNLIHEISEDLLKSFERAALLDKYDVYQHLMNFWTDVMQDDVYAIVADGWQRAAQLRLLVIDRNEKNKEKADLEIGKQKYKADVLPPALVIQQYFAREQAAIENLQAEAERLVRSLEELIEEHGGEEGVLDQLKNDKGNIVKADVQERVLTLKTEILENAEIPPDKKRQAAKIKKEFGSVEWQKGIADEAELFVELDVLHDYLRLVGEQAATNTEIKAQKTALDRMVFVKYSELTVTEIKQLIVDDKWMRQLDTAFNEEIRRLSQNLTARVKTLAARYASTLPELHEAVETLTAKVGGHLVKMGFAV